MIADGITFAYLFGVVSFNVSNSGIRGKSMIERYLTAAGGWVLCVLVSGIAVAEPTAIDVRVISKGAKFVGTSMGGAEVVLRDAETGEVLSRGKTAGTTGDTAKIMKGAATHHAPVSTEDAAVYHAVVDIDEPRRIEITARGPLGQAQAANTVSATQWVVPGKPITGGDAFLLELHGFVVDVLIPPAHIQLSGTPQSVSLQANVCMMCGCPVTPGGLWDADRFEVAAIVYRDGEKMRQVPLEFAGRTSQFQTALQIEQTGAYEIAVFAYDPANGNTGVDKTTFVVTE